MRLFGSVVLGSYQRLSSQPRVVKMEKGDPSVSLDLLVKALLTMGAKKENIAKAIAAA